MKKLLAVVSLLFAVVLVFGACSKEQVPPQKEADVQVVTPQNEENVKDEKPISDESDFIGVEKAKQIALEKAELDAVDVVFERVELEFDNGVWEYEVDFRQGNVEYEAGIKADDGTVLSWEKGIDD